MMRIIAGLGLSGAAAIASSNAALAHLFEIDWPTLYETMGEKNRALLVFGGLPLLCYLLRGMLGAIIVAALVSFGFAGAMTLYETHDLPLEQIGVMAAVYGVVATVVYKSVINRILG